MRKKWTMEQRVRGQNQRAKQAGAKHDLTVEQWLETLEYFDHRCAYCGDEYEVIEHFIESKGVKILFHIHQYRALKEDHVILYCEDCGSRLNIPGLSMDDAKAYMDQYFVNTGFAYSV